MRFETTAEAVRNRDKRRREGVLLEPMWSKKDVAERYGISIATVSRWMKEGLLPPPFKCGQIVRWRVSDLNVFDERARRISAASIARAQA